MTSPLHLAVQARKKDAVKKVLSNKKQKVCVDVVGDLNGFTPIHLACKLGYLDMVQLLLKSKANINSLSTEDESPLIIAAQFGHWEVVEFLLKHGADGIFFSLFVFSF